MKTFWLALALTGCSATPFPPPLDASAPPPAAVSGTAPTAAKAKPRIRGVKFETEVDASSVAALEAEFDAAEAAGEPAIVVQINSPGGEVAAGFELIRNMESRRLTIVCVVDGEAASMAMAILQSCDARLMTRRSQLMAHQGSAQPGLSKEADLQGTLSHLRALDESLVQQYARQAKVSADFVRRRIATGAAWWLDWRDAEKYGFVDGDCRSASEVLTELREGLEG